MKNKTHGDDSTPVTSVTPVTGGARRGRKSEIRPDINLTELSEKIGVVPSYISKLFHGIGTPSLPVAIKLAEEMEMRLEELLKFLEEQRAKAKVEGKTKVKGNGKKKKRGKAKR